MASTVYGYNSYSIDKKFYSKSIQSDSTEMTEEDEDFNTFTNSSSFQTSTTNSSPINAKLEKTEEQLLSLNFYSGPSLANSQLNGKNHSNHIRRSMIQSPSMKNFNHDLYSTEFNRSITTIHESSPLEETPVSMEIPTKQFGMTSSPSMRALENILNQKTRSSLAPESNIESISEEPSDTDFAIRKPPLIAGLHNNQSEVSVASFHTAKSATSVDVDYSEREKLLGDNDDYNDVNGDDMNELDALNSPGLDSDPVKGLGFLSPNILGRKFQVPEKETLDTHKHEFKSMLISDAPEINRKDSLKRNVINDEKKALTNDLEIPKQDTFISAKEEIDQLKKNRRKSFAGFFKVKKSAPSTDNLPSEDQQQRPKAQQSKSSSSVPLYTNNHVKSKSFSNFENLTKTQEDHQASMPRSKSKFFSAFKRRSAYSTLQEESKPKVEKLEPNVASTALPELRKRGSIETLKDDLVIKEHQLAKGHHKRNSILVPSPVLDNHSFEKKPTLFNDLSFSESMVSSINHNYDIFNHSDGEEQHDHNLEVDEEEEDEFNSSFNSIKKSYSNEDSPLVKPSALLPRDISAGSLRMNFDDFNLDDYVLEDFQQQSEVPRLRTNAPVQKLQHHKTSSKIQNLLGEALFPKSLDINEVASITTLERSRSMKSVRSSNGNSLRESLLLDGMTVVQSPNSPLHEPNSTLLSSPSSILKRRSMEYDEDLQEFAKMIDFGDDEDASENFTISIDMSLGDYDYADYEPEDQANISPIKSLKPLPAVPFDETNDDETEEDEPFIKEEDVKQEYEDESLQNPFDYPVVKEESQEDYGLGVKEEEKEFDFGDTPNYIKQESETDEEDTFENDAKDENYNDDNFSVKIKQEEDFDEDFNDYDYLTISPSQKSPKVNAYMPTLDEMNDTQRPISMSIRGLKGPKFGETNNLVQSGSNSHSLYMSLPLDDSSQQIQTSPSRLNLNERILRNYYDTKTIKKVAFSSRIVLFDTYHEDEYDRHPEIATCNQLTPFLAQRIKEELNQVKSEMEVHESSKCYTQFF